MSGRDYRSFITSHRAEEMDRLVRRMTDGVGSNKYDHNVDYNKLKALTMEKRFSSHKTLMKVQKIEQLARQTKENNILKQHRLLWQKEFLHLGHLRKRVQSDVDTHVRENCFGSVCRPMYQNFQYEEAGLNSDFEKFKKDTVEPVWNLKDDLTYWLNENKDDVRLGAPDIVKHHADVMATLASVKQQQAAILDKLDLEQKCLEHDLQTSELSEMCPPEMEKRPKFTEGIPSEAYDMECPDERLKISVLEEFLILDQKYYCCLADLDARHHQAVSQDRFGDWDEDDHFAFVCVYDQYPRELQNRRKLLMDRLKRQLPRVPRSQILKHEDWWLDYKHYNERHKSVVSDWLRDRRELLVKAKVVFAEAMASHELEDLKESNREKQRQICDALYQKVWKWREQKLEVMQLEMELERQWAEEVAEQRQLEEEQEQQRRQHTKNKISRYQDDKNYQRQRQEESNRRRLEELQAELAEQAHFDKERVQYREERLEQRREELQRREHARLQEEEEKERRLEHLREQVRPSVESDPGRLLQETEAWQAHVADEKEEDGVMLQKPLFEINTFTSNQVTSDPRLRLEHKLREAGLHKSDYARQLMSQMKPLHPPRPDMQSTVFKQ